MIRSLMLAAASGLALSALCPGTAARAQGTPTYQDGIGWGFMSAMSSLEECMGAAVTAIKDNGLIPDDIGAGETGVVGGRNGDVLVVQCIPARQVITIVWHGKNNYTLPILNRMRVLLNIDGGRPLAGTPPAAPTSPSPGFGNPAFGGPPTSNGPAKRVP